MIVPPGYRTRADLAISEDEYDGRFRVETIFEGRILVQLVSKKDGTVVYRMNLSDLTRIFKPEHGFHPVSNQPGSVCFITEGHCHCNFGIGQQLELHQEKL